MIYFGGCSITMGAGFEGVQNDPRIYANLVSRQIDHDAINDAEGGSSNLKIFTKAAKAIIDNLADIYVIQWSAPHRHWLYPAPDQGIYIGGSAEDNQYKKFVEQFQQYNHDYPNLMAVIDYSRIITELAKDRKKQVIFVNGMLDWKHSWHDNYMKSLLDELDPLVQQDFRERFDNNIDLLDLSRWANPWQSISDMQEDDAPLDSHPGPETHKKVANLIQSVIDTQQRSI